MKKQISILLLLTLLLALSGCGSKSVGIIGGADGPTQILVTDEKQAEAESAQEAQETPAEEVSREKTDINVFVLTGPTGIGAVNMWNQAEQGIGLENYHFSAVAAPTEIVAKISSGEADIAAVSTNLASTLYHKTEGGVAVLAVNTLGVLNVLDNTGVEISSMADLKGRHIVTTGQGANPEYIINYLLRANGLDPEKDVSIDFKADGSELVTVWANEPEAAIIAPQPVATAIRGKYEGAKLALSLTEEWEKVSPESELMMGCMIVRRAFLEEQPEAVANFLTDYEASVNKANADAEATGALCEQYGIVAQAKMAQAAIPNCNLCYITGDALRDGLTGYLQVLLEANPASVGGSLPGDDFWYAP